MKFHPFKTKEQIVRSMPDFERKVMPLIEKAHGTGKLGMQLKYRRSLNVHKYWKICKESIAERGKAFEDTVLSGPPTALIKPNGELFLANDSALELFGVNKDSAAAELQGLNLMRLPFMSEKLAGIKNGEVVIFEREIDPAKMAALGIPSSLKESIIVEVKISKTAHPANGNTNGYVVHITDITKDAKLAAAISDSERKFRGMFESMKEMAAFHAIIYDKDGKAADYCYIDGNAALAATLGVPVDMLIGKTAKEMFGGEAPYLDIYAQVASSGKPAQFETYFEPIGKHFLVSAVSIAKGQFITITTDITELKKTGLALAESEAELRKKSANSARLLSIINHDVRSALNAAYGFSELISNGDAPTMDDAKKWAGLITMSVSKAINIIGDVAKWRDYGAIVAKPSAFDLHVVVQDNVSQAIKTAYTKGIILFNEVPRGSMLVLADENMVSQVIQNLVSNAIKFTPRDGKITISARKAGGEVEFSVSDNGVGMLPSAVERLFKIDQTFTTNGTENETGTGLGLTIVHELVEKNSGRIAVRSEVGKGTTFTITLPSAQG